MTAPPRPRRKRRTQTDPALSSTPTVSAKSTAESEFDYDRRIVDRVDASIWRAVYNGEFRLAVKCRRCGRWLTDGHSKRRHLGARCAARTGAA